MTLLFRTVAALLVVSAVQAHAGEKIVLGWQVPWATQGQLVQALKHSNIPELMGIEIEYVGFTYGGPLNRAALAGEVDILLTADHPAAVLLSKGLGHKIVSRMMYNRVCLYADPEGDIDTVSDLSGGRVFGPIGAAAERVAIAELMAQGISSSDIRLGSLDMAQQNALITSGGWAQADGLFGFDPLPAIWDEAGLIRILGCGEVVSIVAASDEMLTDRAEDLERFLTAFALAWEAFRQNPEALGALFLEEAELDANQAVLDSAASVEPNIAVDALDKLRFVFTEVDRAMLQEAAQFLIDRGSIPAEFNILDHVDTSLMQTAFEALRGSDLPGRIALDP